MDAGSLDANALYAELMKEEEVYPFKFFAVFFSNLY
jgi:hypothetical protein